MMIPVTTVLAVTLPALICYLAISTVWSVFFGTLSTVPGPKLAAATRLVILSHKARGDTETWILQLHRKYGSAVRVAPYEISFASGSAWKEIYGTAPGSQYAAMDHDQKFYGGVTEEPSILASDAVNHSRQRKCFSHAFSEKALREQEPLIKRYVAQLVSNVNKVATSNPTPIDLAKQYNFTTFDIMADLAFGAPLGCLANSEYVSWITDTFGFLKTITIAYEINHYSFLSKLLKMMVPPSLEEKRRQHWKFSSDKVDKRLSEKTARKDIWHFVLAAEEKNLRLTRGEMHANAGTFMIAGSETSATLLSALTYYLLSSPDKVKILVHEIRNRFASPDEINVQEVLILIYLTACAYEAFRLHPPVPIGLPRIVPKGGAEVCGRKIPEGAGVYAHQFSMYRSHENFAHPDEFLPQRWLSEIDNIGEEAWDADASMTTTEFSNDKRSCLQPFSVGPRNCLGQNLAWLEIRLIMANIIWHFDLELCDESKDWDQQQVFSLWASKPLMVIVKPAKH